MSGILLQLPTPPQVDGAALTELIDPLKDVDGLTPASAGLLAKGRPGLRPCTPAGVMELLRRHDVALEGAEAVVVGRSDLVGKPLAALLLAANATVTTCHSRTRDLPGVCRRADVLVAAVGRPRFVQGDWVKEGAVVIDVGINRTERRPHGRRRLRAGRRARAADHAGARRRRPDDDRDAAAQHGQGGAAPGAGGGGMRLRLGEAVAALGALGLLLAMFLTWYEGPAGEGLDAWQAFAVTDVAARAAGAARAGPSRCSQITQRAPALPVAAGVVTTAAAILTTLLVLYRILNQPGPNDALDVGLGAWLGLLAVLVVAAGRVARDRRREPGGRRRARHRDRAPPGAAGRPVSDS